MSRQWVAVQRNPMSGAGPRRQLLVDLVSGLRRAGLGVRVFGDRAALTRRLEDPEVAARLACIVAAGGDGTIHDVVNRYPEATLAILPMGTENLLARTLRIPRDGRAVARIIAANHVRAFDLGLAGERRFTLMASCGFDADIVHRTDARRSGHITRWNYFQPILESLRKYGYPEMRVVVDGGEPFFCRQLFVMNHAAYGFRLPIARDAVPDDGRFDVRAFQRGSAFRMIRYALSIVMRRHERRADVRVIRAQRLQVTSEQPVPVQVDGDPAGFTPLEISILPGALRVVAPPVAQH
jgi:diacylglycerol kinase family enzyme